MPYKNHSHDSKSFFADQSNVGQLLKLFDVLEIGFFVKDLEGIYRLCNKYIASYDNDETIECICGKRDDELPWKHYAKVLQEIDSSVIADNTCKVYEKVFTDDVRRRFFIIAKAPLHDDTGKPKGVIGLALDITKLKEQQRGLADLIEQREKVIDVCGHEIRGPIHSGTLITENLINEWTTLTDEEKLERIKIVWAANKKVELIAENLFGIGSSRYDTLRLKIKKANLKEVIQKELDLFENAGLLYNNKAEFTIIGEDSFESYFDPIYISQVMANILSNAAKFTDNGKVTVTIQKLEDGHTAAIKVEVSDTGIGIPEDQIKNIFNFAEQSTKTKGHYYGLGIGLALCKEIITKHGGTIWAYNNHNRPGATIAFVIPHKNLELENAFAKKLEDHFDRKLKIVVIDDDVLIHKVFKLILNKSNFELVQIADGYKALEYLEQNCDSIDVVFLDYSLRDFSAMDIINHIAKNPKTAHITNKIIVQSGFTISRDDIRSIRKPYTYEDVIGSIIEVLNQDQNKDARLVKHT